MSVEAVSLDLLKERLERLTSSPSLNRQIEVVSLSESRVVLEAKNKFVRDWFRENYLTPFSRELAQSVGRELFIDIVVKEEPAGEQEPPAVAPALPKPRWNTDGLNSRYHFESFVVGSSNQFAHAAAEAVSRLPGKSYNPLFLYGGVGLGKTHLLNAVGHRILQQHPEAKVLYLSGEKFVNEMIHSLRFEKMSDFRKKYREGCDILLVDDVQFIGGKEKSQEEFFHTFNQLHDGAKQIVLTSDRVPKEITGLEERLRSRFEWGLIADIKPPELETRVAILKKKADQDRIPLTNEVALFLATHITSNVRELEGALIRIHAVSSLTGVAITIPFTKEVLKNVIGSVGRVLTVEEVQKVVSAFFGIRSADLTGRRRTRGIANPRQIAMYLCRKHVKASFPEIGTRFGGKDHSTVVHAVAKIEKRIHEDEQLRDQISSMEQQLTA